MDENEDILLSPAPSLERLGQEHTLIFEAEQGLKELQAELARKYAELLRMHRAAHAQAGQQIEFLRRENCEMRDLLEEGEQRLLQGQEQEAPAANVEDLSKPFRQEIESLQKQLRAKDALIEDLQAEMRNAPESELDAKSIAGYEAELNEFRRQLEADRQVLNTEIVQLRARNAELDEAVRETELELSRERAQMARERTQLDRLREEIRRDWDRLQRDANLRDRLAPVDRLRESPAQEAANGAQSEPENGSSARWRNVFGRRST
jgi:chromosome segregation ATPase